MSPMSPLLLGRISRNVRLRQHWQMSQVDLFSSTTSLRTVSCHAPTRLGGVRTTAPQGSRHPTTAPSWHLLETRRYASDEPSASKQSNPFRHENAIDKFTHFILNVHVVPLGSLKEQQWLDICDAIHAWLEIGSGYAVDSAQRLLQRLIYEHAAVDHQANALAALARRHNAASRSSSNSSPQVRRAKLLQDLHRRVLQSWLDVFHTSQSSSLLALTRAEALLEQTHVGSVSLGIAKDEAFPREQYLMALIDAYLSLQSSKGVDEATRLLLTLTFDLEHIEISDSVDRVGRFFEQTILQWLTIRGSHEHARVLLDRMQLLVEAEHLPYISLSEETEKLLLESSLDRSDAAMVTSQMENADADIDQAMPGSAAFELSDFEVRAMERRLKDALQRTDNDARMEIESFIKRLARVQMSDDLVLALIQFYQSHDDAQNASLWLLKLNPSILMSTKIMEDVLELWSRKRGPRIPWQAEEVLKSALRLIQSQESSTLTKASTQWFNRMIEIWLASDDAAASRKIVDWVTQMKGVWKAQPDATTLQLSVQAITSGTVNGAIDALLKTLLEEWTSLSPEEKLELAEKILQASSFTDDITKTITELFDRLRADGIKPSDSLLKTALNALQYGNTSAAEIFSVIDALEDSQSGSTILSLYAMSMQAMLKSDTRFDSASIDQVFDRALELIVAQKEIIGKGDISDFLYRVIAMHVNRKLYSGAEGYLLRAENAILDPNSDIGHFSLIPLDCYKRLIVRKWYTTSNAPSVETTFRRLKKLHRRGYTNLQPDADIYTGFVRALAALGKVEEVEGVMKEMIELYQATPSEALKPTVESFNTLLLCYGKEKDKTPTQGQKAMDLLNVMERVEVAPDVRTLNLVLQNVIRGRNDKAYTLVTELTERLQNTYDLKPDTYTFHFILDACASVSANLRDEALKRSLSSLHEIRILGGVGPTTYGILSRVIYRLGHRGGSGDKVAPVCFALCCEDGRLTTEARRRFQKSMSEPLWKQLYENKLAPDGAEPIEWSRNVATVDNDSIEKAKAA